MIDNFMLSDFSRHIICLLNMNDIVNIYALLSKNYDYDASESYYHSITRVIRRARIVFGKLSYSTLIASAISCNSFEFIDYIIARNIPPSLFVMNLVQLYTVPENVPIFSFYLSYLKEKNLGDNLYEELQKNILYTGKFLIYDESCNKINREYKFLKELEKVSVPLRNVYHHDSIYCTSHSLIGTGIDIFSPFSIIGYDIIEKINPIDLLSDIKILVSLSRHYTMELERWIHTNRPSLTLDNTLSNFIIYILCKNYKTIEHDHKISMVDIVYNIDKIHKNSLLQTEAGKSFIVEEFELYIDHLLPILSSLEINAIVSYGIKIRDNINWVKDISHIGWLDEHILKKICVELKYNVDMFFIKMPVLIHTSDFMYGLTKICDVLKYNHELVHQILMFCHRIGVTHLYLKDILQNYSTGTKFINVSIIDTGEHRITVADATGYAKALTGWKYSNVYSVL